MSKELMRPGLPDILRINIPNMEKLDRIWRFIPFYKYRTSNPCYNPCYKWAKEFTNWGKSSTRFVSAGLL